MNENEIIKKLDFLLAQNLALMFGVLTVVRNMPVDREKLRSEYDFVTSSHIAVMLEKNAPESLSAQREAFEKMRRVMFPDY